MINDHWSFEERHSLRHPPGCQCACNKAEHGAERTDQLAADRAGNRADDEADERFEQFHPGLSDERRICRAMFSTIIATSGLRSIAPTGGMIRRRGWTIQSVRM